MITARINFLKKLLILFFTFVFLLLGTELIFRFFVIKSDSISFTLISKAWFKRYWRPINSLGYRDIEHPAANLRGKKTIFVVGDSIVAGHGIKDYKDRFSNVLQDKLGNSWAVVNIAQCGWSTKDEYKAVLSYPYKPDIMILSYHINDMENSAMSTELDIKRSVERSFMGSSKIIRHLSNYSYAFNYFYYRLYFIKKWSRDYKNIMENCYLNTEAWEDHKKELGRIVDYAKKEKIELIVLIYFKPKISHKAIYSKIIDFMKSNNIMVIDLMDIFKSWNRKDLNVSFIDAHPSVNVHKIIGNKLFEYIHSTH